MSEDEFEPHLGKMRARGDQPARNYAGRIAAAAGQSAGQGGARKSGFDGSRIGRGASMGRLLGSRDPLAAHRHRRTVVKVRLVRLGTKGLPVAAAHIRYIQRDGVTREGDPGALYSQQQDLADEKAFLERCDGDRHQFRFIVSAEDGSEYPDLKPLTRRFMAQVEKDLGTTLDWVAVDHYNTGHPHSHIMLRGVDDQGKDLIIARDYIAQGLRERAAEIVSLDLGPRTAREIEARLQLDIGVERLTAIDHQLVRRQDTDRIVSAADRDPFRQSLKAGRLQKLGSLGLANDIGGGRWQLADRLEDRLRQLGERGDIIRTMQRELSARRLDRPWLDRGQRDPVDGPAPPIVGRLIARGLSDEHRDRHFLIVDGVDGEAHYLDIGRGEAMAPIAEGAVVRVVGRGPRIRDVDRTIAKVAAANDGRYSIDRHLRHDPGASQAFAEAHVRRLEAMRKTMGSVIRDPDGSWTIAADHMKRAAAYEAHRFRDQPVVVETLSYMPVERLPRIVAATWLDRELASATPLSLGEAGFGRDVRDALTARRQWLVEQQMADGEGAGFRLRASALMLLAKRELIGAGERLSEELSKSFVEARAGQLVEGKISRRVDLVSGRFALIEKSREFVLVPWGSVLENQIGKSGSGIMRSDGISWRLGRDRNGPEIS